MREIKIKLSEAAREVLARSTITADSVKLPEQLDRKLYVEIDKVFKAAGGKWNRGRGVHLFGSDPREILGLAVEVGAIVDTKKTLQQFFTSPELADRMVEAAGLTSWSKDLLEPSAGTGAIVAALRRRAPQAIIVAVELDRTLADALSGPNVVYSMDFLLCSPMRIGKFDRVIMNPPFSDGQGIKHIAHALEFLRPGGKLVAICPNGPRENEILKPIATTWERLPAGTFHEVGTEVRTVLLTIQT